MRVRGENLNFRPYDLRAIHRSLLSNRQLYLLGVRAKVTRWKEKPRPSPTSPTPTAGLDDDSVEELVGLTPIDLGGCCAKGWRPLGAWLCRLRLQSSYMGLVVWSGGPSPGCGGNKLSGRHACCSVLVLSRLLGSDPWQKTVRVVASTVYWVNPISADGRFLFSPRGAPVKGRRSWRAVSRTCAGLVVVGRLGSSRVRAANLVRGCVG
jgi:hypothetical protein